MIVPEMQLAVIVPSTSDIRDARTEDCACKIYVNPGTHERTSTRSNEENQRHSGRTLRIHWFGTVQTSGQPEWI
jgi:hypothetical protein